MFELIAALSILFMLCFWLVFRPITHWTKLKFGLASIFIICCSVALGFSWYIREQSELANQFDKTQQYQSLVEAYLDGKQIDAENIDARDFILALQRYLQKNYRDSDAWMVMGNMLQNEQDMRPALMAYQRAHRVNPDNHDLSLAYVSAKLADAEKRRSTQLDWEIVEILENIVNSDTHQVGEYENALMMLGAASFQGGDFSRAEQAWQLLYERLQTMNQVRPVPSDVMTALEQSIEKAKQKNGQTEQFSHVSDSNLFEINIVVEISEQAREYLQRKPLPDQATLFIYAKQAGANASPMPLAAIRQSISDLNEFPLTLNLRQSHALMGNDLTQQGDLSIAARLSLKGEAKPSSGDWQSHAVVYQFNHTQNAIVLKIIEVL